MKEKEKMSPKAEGRPLTPPPAEKPPFPPLPPRLESKPGVTSNLVGGSGTILGEDGKPIPGPIQVSPERAGGFFKKLFSILHVFIPAWAPLEDAERAAIEEDAADFINSVPWLQTITSKLPKISFLITLLGLVVPRVRAVQAAILEVKKAKDKNARSPHAPGPDSRPSGDGEDHLSPGPDSPTIAP